MKKLITGILAILSCFAFAVGCTDDSSSSTPSGDLNTESSDTGSSDTGSSDTGSSDTGSSDTGSGDTGSEDEEDNALEAAKEVLYADMLEDSNKSTYKNYTIKNTYYSWHAEKDFTVTVSVDVTAGVTVEAGETDWTVKIDQALEADLPYVLTVTISDGESNVSFTLNRTALKAPSIVPQEITAKPVEETAYKLYMYQVTKYSDEYFNGSLDKTGYYLATSLSHEYATDVYVDYVEGSDTNFNIYFFKDNVKQYIGIYNSYNNKGYHLTPTFNPEIDNFEHVTSKSGWSESNTYFAGSYVFTWSETYGTFVTTIANAKYDESTSKDPASVTATNVTAFLGTSGTYFTFGGMNVSEIDNADSCIGKLVEMVDKNAIPAETKIATEARAIPSLLDSSVAEEKSYTLPAVGATYADVAIDWAVTAGNDIASITDGVLTITSPQANTIVTVTATLTLGDSSSTKNLTIIVLKPVEVEGIDCIFSFTFNEETQYLSGFNSGKGVVTSDIANAATFTLVLVDEANSIYNILLDGKYLALTSNSTTALSLVASATDATTEWKIADEKISNSSQVTNSGAVSVRALGYNKSSDVRAYATSTEYPWVWYSEINAD